MPQGYNDFKRAISASLNVGAGAGTNPLQVYCMLVGALYTPDVDTHVYRSSVDNEITGTYNAGGFALSSPVFSTNNTSNRGVFDAADVFLATVTFNTTPVAAVLYGSSGLGAASDPLIVYVELVGSAAVTAATFQIQFSADGVFYLT